MILTHFFASARLLSTCDFHTAVTKSAKPIKNLVGAAIRKIRASSATKISQQDLAGRLAALGIQIDRSALARIENGDRSVRDFEARAIADALHVPLEKLFPKR